MKLSKIKFIAGVFLLSFGTIFIFIRSYAADVYCPPGEQFKWDKHMEIIGEITVADTIAVRNCLQGKNTKVKPSVDVNSPGGDVYAAMEIGRLFRKYRVTFVFPLDSQCLSSCVFMLAGAVVRYTPTVIDGDYVGIHRPYSLKTGKLDFTKTQEDYQKVRDDVKKYLMEMNIPTSLFSAMERIPPEEIRFLTAKEIEEFGLEGYDPVEQELQDASAADLRGISRREYYRREIEGERECKDKAGDGTDYWLDCREAFSWGLSLGVYKIREARRKKICKSSQERRTCTREVLLGVS